MAYTALYRKFRPKDFSEVKGQDHIVKTLKNEILSDRIAHAYLFTGTRGTGKTSVAKIFARALNCENRREDGSPCGECAMCKAALNGSSVNVIEMDAASNNGVDDIRTIIEEVSYPPSEGRMKVYIIDEVHMLSSSAFNALLKTLEEPPSYVVFILATTEVHKLPITILSRVQRFDFKRIGIDVVSDRITELLDAEGVTADYKAIRYIARVADGSMRDALSLLDRCISFYLGEHLTYEKVLDVLGTSDTETFSKLTRCLILHDAAGAIKLIDEAVLMGRELSQFVSELIFYIRNLLLCKGISDLSDIIDMSEDNLKALNEEAKMVEDPVLERYIRELSSLYNNMRYSGQKRILLEVSILKICRPETEDDYSAVVDRVSYLEERLNNGDFSINPENINESTVKSDTKKSEGVLKKPRLPDALPEDILNTIKKWKDIVPELSTVKRNYLKHATVSVDPDNKGNLLLVFDMSEDIGRMGYDTLSRKEEIKEIEEKIEEQIGAHVPVLIKENNTGRENGAVYPDALKMLLERSESLGVPTFSKED